MKPPRQRSVLAALAVVASLLAAGAATAADWLVDSAQSRLTFHPTLAGGEFEGRFERFDAAVRFDPADLTHARLQVAVDLPGARTGDGDRDAALQGPEFFQSERWPQARFASTNVRALGGDRYEIAGRLTLRDASQPVNLVVRFTRTGAAGGEARLTGSTTLHRLDFGVGRGEWQSTEWLADAVRVEFDLRLRAAP
jgi:polyisoprenoid-binding protein YceI